MLSDMYERYVTEAIVLGSKPRKEADRVLDLLTHDFGLVQARGISLRVEKSKMRYSLQDLALVDVDLVRGRDVWRVAGARAHDVFWKGNDAGLQAFARIARLARRLVQGEERHEELFDVLKSARSAFESQELDPVLTELLSAARVLHVLGYLSDKALGTVLFTHTTFAVQDLAEAASLREKLRSSVNSAISETHL